MAFSAIRYYYYLEDDLEQVEQMTAACQEADISASPHSPGTFFQETDEQSLSRLQCGNIIIIILRLKYDQGTWDAYLQTMEALEKAARLAEHDLLARVTVLGASDCPWEKLLETARGICSYQEAIPFPLEKGRLVRLDWRWPNGKAFYLFLQQDSPPVMERFFGSGLPQLEAGLIRLNMIGNLYKDRNNTIIREINNCDTRLSNILHTQLVTENAAARKVEELESQVQELSASYGVLAGDYGMIGESINRIKGLADAVAVQIKAERFFVNGNDLKDVILSPYYKRLNELKNTVQDLRASRENHQAAIDVVRSRIDIMLSRENIATQAQIKQLMELNTSIQQQSLTFQIAAGIIEFIVLAYYSHSLWKNLAHAAYDLVPPWVQLVMVVLFSWATVYCTHLVAEYRQGDTHVKKKMLLYSSFLLLLLIAIIFGTYWLQLKGAH